MPTQSEEQRTHLSVRAPRPKPQAAPVTVRYMNGPIVPDSFSIIAYHKSSKTWKYLDDFLINLNWDDSLDEAALSAKMSLNNTETANGTRIASYVGKGTQVRLMFSANGSTWQEIGRFMVWGIHRKDGSGGPTVEITLYDGLMHLKSSYDTFLYYSGNRRKKTPWNAYQITRDICRRFGIPLGHVPKFKKMKQINYIYSENTSIYDMLLKVWSLERAHSKKKFVIRMHKGKLSITVKKPLKRLWELTGLEGEPVDVGGLMSADLNSYIDPGDHEKGTATRIRVRGIKKDASGEDARRAVIVRTATNVKLKKQIGLLQKVYTVEGLTNKHKADKKARTLLKAQRKPKTEANVVALGIPFVRAGDPVYVRDMDAALKGKLWISSVSQTLDGNGSYTMSITLNLTDIVPKLMPDRETLKPAESGTSITDAEAAQGMTRPGGMPDWLYKTLIRAAPEAGVPVAWASSNSLSLLLAGESSYNPNAQNPTSTAYGLFQFLDSTWAGTGVKKTSDPYKQCVAGLRYIKNRYRNPERAYQFWRSHNPHWY